MSVALTFPRLTARGVHPAPAVFRISPTRHLHLQLTAYAARDWRASFFPVGIAHSIVVGSAWEPTPWRAVQRAAWETLNKTGA